MNEIALPGPEVFAAERRRRRLGDDVIVWRTYGGKVLILRIIGERRAA